MPIEKISIKYMLITMVKQPSFKNYRVKKNDTMIKNIKGMKLKRKRSSN